MGAPWAEVPLPAGKPVPSGKMLMSQAASSAGSIGLPRFGPWAKAALEPRASRAAKIRGLRVNMFHLPIALDRPSRDAVVVLAREARYGGNLRGLAARGHDLGAGRLHVAGLVPRAALQNPRTAIPAPGHAEAGKGLAVHRLLQRRLLPALAAIGRDYHLRYPAIARIGDAGDLIEAGLLQHHPWRGVGDERFDLLQKIKLIRLSARQDRRIGSGLVVTHGGLLDQFDPAQELDVHVAFPARQEQAHRITVPGHEPLAVLVERDHGIVQCLGDRHAAAQGRRVRTFGDEPLRLGIDAGLLEQGGEPDAGPLGARSEAVQLLRARLDRLFGKEWRAVAAAFDKRHARHHRVTPERIEREDQRPLDETVNYEAVLTRGDVRVAGAGEP